MTSGPTIDYEALQQDAFRGVIKAVLTQTAEHGLPGDHHFYISFNTRAPNVGLSRRLREKYPQEMTIVLQHRFWGLAVFDDRFEVNLTFDNIPERLVVPFQAIRVFVDPSVRYGLQFEIPDLAGGDGEHDTRADGETDAAREAPSRAPAQRPATVQRRPRARKVRPERDLVDAAAPASAGAEGGEAASPGADTAAALAPPAANGDTKVISLDAFRKK